MAISTVHTVQQKVFLSREQRTKKRNDHFGLLCDAFSCLVSPYFDCATIFFCGWRLRWAPPSVPSVLVFVCREHMEGHRKCCTSPLTLNRPRFDRHDCLVNDTLQLSDFSHSLTISPSSSVDLQLHWEKHTISCEDTQLLRAFILFGLVRDTLVLLFSLFYWKLSVIYVS